MLATPEQTNFNSNLNRFLASDFLDNPFIRQVRVPTTDSLTNIFPEIMVSTKWFYEFLLRHELSIVWPVEKLGFGLHAQVTFLELGGVLRDLRLEKDSGLAVEGYLVEDLCVVGFRVDCRLGGLVALTVLGGTQRVLRDVYVQ